MGKIPFIVFIAMLFSCSSSDKKNDRPSSSLPTINRNNRSQNEKSEELYLDLIKEYESGYSSDIFIDSSVTLNSDVYIIQLEKFCQFDSSIVIPKKYVGFLGIEQFTTHNFKYHLEVKKNGAKIIDSMISKSNFTNLLEDHLKNYGVLLYPELDIENQRIQFNFSLSIPLTDVGLGVYVRIKDDTSLKYDIYK